MILVACKMVIETFHLASPGCMEIILFCKNKNVPYITKFEFKTAIFKYGSYANTTSAYSGGVCKNFELVHNGIFSELC